MKRLIALLLALVMVLGLCACGGSSSKFNPQEELKTKIYFDARIACTLNYADVKGVSTSITDIDVNGDIYTAKGKVTVVDNYGDKYVGKITGVYRLNGETFSQVSLDIETPKKQ
ncbi:MAG: hypothetical protein IIY40_07565 [Firmicutes bacterium]|nr:hypothetical protein [Bacillota bacterium]